ncbi:MAG TPA: lysylphosphatidylglycerol synthase transmembrane domain-containing protein [Solirubrobacteraceae bacterium]|nr:lysylphosphatidylglycerol synthase transmembrane domain-containing protein [Solirubrobacteraceae bacterium]
MSIHAAKPDGRPSGGPSGPGGRRTLLVRVGLLVALLGAVAVAIAGLIPGSTQRLERASTGGVVTAILAEALACAAYADLFHTIFSGGRWRLSPLRSVQVGLAELAAFVVVPTGIGGPALRVWALLRSGLPFAAIVERSVVHAAVLNLPFAVAAAVLGVTVVTGLGPGHASTLVALAPLALIIVLTALALLMARYLRADAVPPGPGWQRFGHDAADAIPGGIRQIPAALRSPRRLAGGLVYWAGDCGVLILTFAALGGSPPLGTIVLAYLLGQLGNALPLPGGIGGVEPLMLGVLSSSGVDLGLGGAAVLLYRIISLGLQTLLGTIAVLSLTPALTTERSAGEEGAGAISSGSAEGAPGTPSVPEPTTR